MKQSDIFKNLVDHKLNMDKMDHSKMKLQHMKLKHDDYVKETFHKEQKRKVDYFKNLQKIMEKQNKPDKM